MENFNGVPSFSVHFFVDCTFPEGILTGRGFSELTEMLLQVKLHKSYQLSFSRVQSLKKIKQLINGSHP